VIYPGNRRRLLLVAACAIGASQLQAAEIGVSSTQPLSFGKFVAGDGSITVGANGTRLATGEVVVLESGPGSAAQLLVTGDANLSYSVTLPVDGSVSITNGASSMPVNGFVSSPGSAGTLSPGGTQLLNVGARLDVGRGQPAGDYTGSFIVIVEYD
jgi:hypothetical protein